MSNTQQNNMQNEINFLQDRLKKNEKSLNQFQNGLKQIGRMQVKKDKGRIIFKPKKYKIL